MNSNTARCLETTLVSGVMAINTVLPLPTWMVVLALLCLVWVWIPDNIEIWI